MKASRKNNDNERAMKPIGKYLACILFAGLAQIATAEVTVSIDRGNLGADDTFVLTLKATAGEDLNNTNFGPLNQDFDAIQSRRESSVNIINGKRESSTKLHITLAPKSTGRLLIPALTVDGQTTTPITLMVRDSRDDLNAFDPVFVEAEVDNSKVYVQGQVIFTFRISRAIALTDMGYSGLEIADAPTEQLDGTNFTKTIDGQNYQVNELRFAIFPQDSGTLEIPPLEFTGRQATQRRGFFDLGNRGSLVRRKSDAISIEVLPVPDAYPNAAWLPSRELTLTEDWSSPPEMMKIGDSTTRTITMKAEGLTGPQLPPISSPELDGIKIYPDQPKNENITSDRGITALGLNSAAWVVINDGEFEIPEVRIPWWDTDDHKLRYATIPARRLSVAPAVVPETAPATAVQPNPTDINNTLATPLSPGLWQWATAAAVCGWLLTTLLLLRRRSGPGPAKDAAPAVEKTEARLFKELLSTSHSSGDARQVRSALVAWTRALWPDSGNPGIATLIDHADDEKLVQELEQLEQSLYAGNHSKWQGQQLAEQLPRWRKALLRKREAAGKNPLPPLYTS
jgi:hypothetical protein